jgi:hypothetical protein
MVPEKNIISILISKHINNGLGRNIFTDKFKICKYISPLSVWS